MSKPWSFYEDAVFRIGDSDVAKGRTAIDPTVKSIEEWLTDTFSRIQFRSSAWLFLFSIASTALLIAALYETSFIALILVLIVAVTVTAYWHEKSFFSRLVKRVRDGALAPKNFIDDNGEAARNYISSIFSTSRIIFDSFDEPARLGHRMTALDLVWLTSIKEALPLKRALCGRDEFPVAISRPECEVVAPLSQPESPPTITYNVTHEAIFDQRQLHIHATGATADNPHRKTSRKSKSKAATEIAPHWLYPLDQTYVDARLVSFEEHLPKSLKWMSLIILHAYPVIQRHQGWSDANLLDKALEHIATLRSIPNGRQRLHPLPDSGTIKKMFNRGRSDPNYGWVQEYFTDPNRPHKYQNADQDRLPLSNPD
jgi:hypothetical protein